MVGDSFYLLLTAFVEVNKKETSSTMFNSNDFNKKKMEKKKSIETFQQS